MPEGGQRDGVTYEAYDGIVEHLFFHPVIAYPELAFDGDAQEKGLDDYMVTAEEFLRILESVYERGYVLVDIADVVERGHWRGRPAEDGPQHPLSPEGKKPLIFSYDDTNYYEYMLENGFHLQAHSWGGRKDLVLGPGPGGQRGGLPGSGRHHHSGQVRGGAPGLLPLRAKACLSLTGYEGILGYRTQTDGDVEWTEEREAFRQSEREAVKPSLRS